MELKCLEDMYHPSKSFEVSRLYKKIVINDVDFVSKHSRSQRSAVIAAKWPGVVGIDSRGEKST